MDKNTLGTMGKKPILLAAWTEWGPWGECSLTCGGGEKVRRRRCEIPGARSLARATLCPGPETDTMKCNENKCPEPTEWSGWFTNMVNLMSKRFQ